MLLSKIIVQYLVETMTIAELQEFTKSVLVPQNAKNLIAHFAAAEEILQQQGEKEI